MTAFSLPFTETVGIWTCEVVCVGNVIARNILDPQSGSERIFVISFRSSAEFTRVAFVP